MGVAPLFTPDYHGAVCVPTDHHGGAIVPRFFIFHGTSAGTQQSAADVMHDFQTTNADSAHYSVGRGGDVAQGVPEDLEAWCNGPITGAPGTGGPAAGQHDPWWSGDGNRETISCETVNAVGNGLPLAAAQQAVCFALAADVCRRRGIPPRKADAQGGITGHYSLDPIQRAFCPGPNFPWAALWAWLDAHSLRSLPRPESMSEFHGFFGDCTQLAHLTCLNQIDPVRWPFTAAELNTLTKSDIAHGWADPSGAQNLGGLANSIRNEGLAFHQSEDQAGMLRELDTWGGVKPIMLGFNLGGRLPGDEPGVQGHAIACVAWDHRQHVGLFCDGDNKAAGAPLRYTLADLQNAAWESMTVFDTVPAGGTVLSTNLGAGFAAYVTAHGITAPLVTPGEIPTGDPRYPGEAFAAFADGTILYYTRAFGVRADRGPWLVKELWDELTKVRQLANLPEGGT